MLRLFPSFENKPRQLNGPYYLGRMQLICEIWLWSPNFGVT